MQLYFLVRLKLVVSKIVLRLLTLGIWLPSGQAPGQQQHDYKQQHVGSSYKTLCALCFCAVSLKPSVLDLKW